MRNGTVYHAEAESRPATPVMLIVDDEADVEPMMRQRFRRAVREGRLRLLFAHDGEQALEVLSETPDVDLVLTDINMPRMDGLTLLERLGQLGERPTKAIIVSAYGDLANIRAGMNRGAFDFVTKPIAFEDLELTIERAMEKVRSERQALAARARLIAMEEEFDWARRVQTGILPRPWPNDGPEQLCGVMRPAREVGGDLYDFMAVGDDHIAFMVGDVAGKGIAAALVAAITHALLRSFAVDLVDPAECLWRLNAFLAANNPEMMFVTVLCCVLQRSTGIVRYASAGHPWPLCRAADETVTEWDGKRGIPVGVALPAQWSTHEGRLRPGDMLFCLTDGLTEAHDRDGELFGDERLAAALARHDGDTGALTRKVIAEVDAFADGTAQADDLTCVTLRWRDLDATRHPVEAAAKQDG